MLRAAQQDLALLVEGLVAPLLPGIRLQFVKELQRALQQALRPLALMANFITAVAVLLTVLAACAQGAPWPAFC